MSDFEEAIKRFRNINSGKVMEEPKYECAICHDTGIISYKGEDGYDYGRQCECVAIKRAKQMIRQSGISDSFQKLGFNDFETMNKPELVRAKTVAINYFKGFEAAERTRQNSILLSGQVGAGKTHLGVAISNNLLEQRVAVIYMPYRNVVTALKQSILDDEAYSREMNKYLDARVLFIDDMLKGNLTKSDVNIMYEIVNYRYLNNMPMIISTEKKPEELMEFDEAIGSRILEMCRGNIIVFRDKALNYRLRGIL
ncbi:MAG: ATP-binding protein [Eubacterium sp.]|nr:ATP-binding protein [Eubacterium sp.]